MTYSPKFRGSTLSSALIQSLGTQPSVAVKTSAYTITANDDTIEVDASSGAVVVSLPAATNRNLYRIIKIDNSANAVTIAAFGSDNINGDSTKILTQLDESVTLGADGISSWYSFSSTFLPFVGDTGSGGVQGLVPAPMAGDSPDKFLNANGAWEHVSGIWLDGTSAPIDSSTAAITFTTLVATVASMSSTRLDFAGDGNWGGAYALSPESFTGDGFIEFVVGAQSQSSIVGLQTVPGGLNTDVDYGAYLYFGYGGYAHLGGLETPNGPTFANGDVIRIRRQGNQIILSRNLVDEHTFTTPINPSTPLYFVATSTDTSSMFIYGIATSYGTGAVPGTGADGYFYINTSTGDVYLRAYGIWTIVPALKATSVTNNAISNTMLAQMAGHTFKGNNTGSTTNPIDLTATQLTAELDVFTGDSGSGGLKGLVPAPLAGQSPDRFLNAGGAWLPTVGTWLSGTANPVSAVTGVFSFTGLANTTISGGNMIVTFNSGSVCNVTSVESFTGDGYIEFKPGTVGVNQVLGLQSGAGLDYTDIDFAVQLGSSGLNIFQMGAFLGAFGSIPVVGDTVRVERFGSDIIFSLNGTPVETIVGVVSPSLPLHFVGWDVSSPGDFIYDLGGSFAAGSSNGQGYDGDFYLQDPKGIVWERSMGMWVIKPIQGATSNLRYYGSTTSISGSLTTIDYTTMDYDATGLYTSGVTTVALDGKYDVKATLLVSGTIALNDTVIMEIQVNGAVVSRATQYVPAALTNFKIAISDTISCVATDTIQIQVSTTIAGPAIVSSNFDNCLSISYAGI